MPKVNTIIDEDPAARPSKPSVRLVPFDSETIIKVIIIT